MTRYPEIKFHIPGAVGEILPDSPLWHLALSEKAFEIPCRERNPAGNFTPPITIGDYFLAARRFLFNDSCRVLNKALREQTGTPLFSPPHPVTISLSLEKHGAFYHPIKVLIQKHAHLPCALVLNGAVSIPGLALVEKEYLLLSKIVRQVPLSVFPRVYGQGRVTSGKEDIGFFLGEWFDKFHEFHVSIRNQEPCIALWEPQGKIEYFTLDEAAHIYRSIAFVLTSAYTLETGKQIFPWHHAAGDFIVNPVHILNPAQNGLAVKLITVRGYDVFAPLEGDGENKEVPLLVRLLIFFLDTSLRMQLDKVNGIGETVFLGEAVLKAFLTGFFKGLDVKAAAGYGDLRQAFVEFFCSFTPAQLIMIFENILGPLKKDAPESAVIQKNLKGHCRSLYTLVKTEYMQDFY